MQDNKLMMANECTSFAGRFDFLGHPPLQYWAHRPMEDVLGYIRGHWTPPPGDYLQRIAPAAARVIGFGTHNQGWGGENGTSDASSKKAQNRPSTHIIDAASFAKFLPDKIGLKILAIFLAIKHWQRTTNGELTKHQRSLSKSGRSWPSSLAVKTA